MPCVVTANDIPGILEFSPDRPFTCIFLAPTTGRRCGYAVNARDRATASRIRERIMSSTRHSPISDDDLKQYAELCCCVRYHRVQIVEDRIINPLVQRWRHELTHKREVSVSQIPPNSTESISTRFEDLSARVGLSTTSSRSFTRTTRSRTAGDRIQSEEVSSGVPKFEPYTADTTMSMSDAITAPLSEQQRRSGSFYSFSRSSDRGFYKVGCASASLEQRRIQLERCSGPNNPVTVEYSVTTANAYRTEQLTQLELRQYRRKERQCLNYPNCATQHLEWFEVNLSLLKRVMSRWSQWMNDASPYDGRGILKRPWQRYCRQLDEEGTAISSSELYLAYQQGLVNTEDDDNATPHSSSDQQAPQNATVAAEDCPICYESINEPARTTCGHDFCSECIARWFETSNRCPMCRNECVLGEVSEAGTAEIPMQNSVGTS